MTDIQYNTTIMGGPTRFGFSPKASGFYPFGDATALAGDGGVRGCGVADSSFGLKSDMPQH